MPTMQTVADVPPAHPAVAPTPAPEPSAPAPDVTIPTVANAAPAVPAPAPAPAAEKKVSSPADASQPKKSKKGILLTVLIAAACFVLVSGAVLTVIFLSGPEEPAPVPGPDHPGTGPVPAAVSGPDTPSNIADSPVTLPQQPVGGASGRQAAAPDVVTDIARGAEQPPQAGPDIPEGGKQTAMEEMTPDPLGKHQIVLLADTSSDSREAKSQLAESFGAESVSFQEAEGMGSYKQLLKMIVKSDPAIVVLCFARQYAEDGISASGYENVMAFHADQFQENGIPFVFIQPSDEEDDTRIRAFRDATTELCRQRSIPFLDAGDLASGKLIPIVRENKRTE